MAEPERIDENWLIEERILRLNAAASGLGFGLLGGLGLFLATLVLVLRGGEWQGEHLGLLSQYFPGYSVSLGGAFLGAIYGFVVAGGVGSLVASIYNRLAR